MDDFAAFGVEPPADIAAALDADEQEFEVEPEVWQIVQAWMRVQTQWRFHAGGIGGLDYPAVFATLERIGVRDDDGRVFEGIQVMEVAALKILNRES